jgi:MoxR-like ATPase
MQPWFNPLLKGPTMKINLVPPIPTPGAPRTDGDFPVQTLDDVRSLCRNLIARCRAMVQGRDDVIQLLLIALLADGHVLLEDHPGSGKTTLAKALGESIVRDDWDDRIAPFRRVQFTPDLLPSDVTGVTMFDPESKNFEFRPGPIFANVLLADEINRTSPKVQAALLEAMGEKQVTVDNHTHRLEDLFFVIATQNPLDLVGTYPLPRAQLDRFLFKVRMTYLARHNELEVLARWRSVRDNPPRFQAAPGAIVRARQLIQHSVRVAPAIHECLVDIAGALRADKRVALGASTRSLVLALPALQARAVIHGRDFVSPQDIKALAMPLFAHRLELARGARDADTIVAECVAPVVEAATRRTLWS